MKLLTGASKGHRIAAVGMYDGVHQGHRFLIDFLCRKGRERGLTPAVVTFSSHPLTVVNPSKAPGLLSTLEQRIDLLASRGIQDCIVLDFDRRLMRLSAADFLKRLKTRYGIDALVVGFNNRFGHDRVDGVQRYKEIGAALGMEIIEAPEYRSDGHAVSSSAVRKALLEGDIAGANAMLNRRYELTGRVVHGNEIGRTIGFPTANIEPETTNALVPGNGVYAALITTPDGQRRAAMVNIGCRPTVTNDDADDCRRVIEAHILDFNGCIYDDMVKLEFVERLRDERHFQSLDKLKKQLETDRNSVKRITTKLM